MESNGPGHSHPGGLRHREGLRTGHPGQATPPSLLASTRTLLRATSLSLLCSKAACGCPCPRDSVAPRASTPTPLPQPPAFSLQPPAEAGTHHRKSESRHGHTRDVRAAVKLRPFTHQDVGFLFRKLLCWPIMQPSPCSRTVRTGAGGGQQLLPSRRWSCGLWRGPVLRQQLGRVDPLHRQETEAQRGQAWPPPNPTCERSLCTCCIQALAGPGGPRAAGQVAPYVPLGTPGHAGAGPLPEEVLRGCLERLPCPRARPEQPGSARQASVRPRPAPGPVALPWETRRGRGPCPAAGKSRPTSGPSVSDGHPSPAR